MAIDIFAKGGFVVRVTHYLESILHQQHAIDGVNAQNHVLNVAFFSY